MFQFPWFPSLCLCIQHRILQVCCSGFPHSGIPGSQPACGSPRHIAAYRALHRLLVPRHPPCALSSLTFLRGTMSFALLCRFGRLSAHVPTVRSAPRLPRSSNRSLLPPLKAARHDELRKLLRTAHSPCHSKHTRWACAPRITSGLTRWLSCAFRAVASRQSRNHGLRQQRTILRRRTLYSRHAMRNTSHHVSLYSFQGTEL